MKLVLIAGLILTSITASAGDVCKKDDLKGCAKALKAKEGAEDFVVTYNQVCTDNKTFKCLKRTVRGEVSDELKYIKEEFPKAHFFTVKDGDENKVFVLDKK